MLIIATCNIMKGNTHYPRFPEVLHQLLNDAEANGHEHIVSWLPCGRRFKVHNTSIFATVIMPRYFNHNLYKSFLRQLSLYEFRRGSWKSSPGPKGSYDHPFFQKNRPDLLCGVIRVKNRKLSKSAWSMCEGGDDEIHCGGQSLTSATNNFSFLSSARTSANNNSETFLVGTSERTSSAASSSSSSSSTIYETHHSLSPEDIVQEIIQTFATGQITATTHV